MEPDAIIVVYKCGFKTCVYIHILTDINIHVDKISRVQGKVVPAAATALCHTQTTIVSPLLTLSARDKTEVARLERRLEFQYPLTHIHRDR